MAILHEWHGHCEDIANNHDKIWAACLEDAPTGGTVFVAQYGRRGESVKLSTKMFASRPSAQLYYDRTVREKQGKGYRAVNATDARYGFAHWPGQMVPVSAAPYRSSQIPAPYAATVVQTPQPILLARKNTPAAARMITCPICREQTDKDEEFCDECGAHLTTAWNNAMTGAIVARPAPDPQVLRNALLPQPAAKPAQKGMLLANRYRIGRKLGQGGFGAVYEAEDTLFGRIVAIKEMLLKSMNTGQIAEAVEAFEREGNLLARLTHPNLPRIYDKFQQGRSWYLVMDFIEGVTLEELQNTQGIFPVADVRAIGLQLCNVLGYLHAQNPPIIFRDLKPGNIMLTPDERVYLIDFGIARLYKAGQSTDTRAFGTNGYAAPEQYGKAQSGVTADVYSLGATLHHLLSGNDPADSIFHFAPFDAVHRVPVAMEDIIMQCVEMDVHKRPQQMADVARLLEL